MGEFGESSGSSMAATAPEPAISFGAFRLTRRTGELWRGGTEVRLTPRAAAVLALLLERPQEIVTKQELLERVWEGSSVGDEALTSCIRELRRVLDDDAREPRYIETRHRRGYRLVVPVATATPAATLLTKPSVAVMAFQNMSGDPAQEYFVDGLVEDIITALSRISAFSVIARNSSFTYKDRVVDVRQVGQDLGARYVLNGSVRKAGARLRITGQLVDATTGNHVWADRYDGALEDVFDLQDRITSSVVAVIEPKVQQAEIARAQAKSTESLTAYDLYLRAFAAHSDYEDQSNNDALGLLARAVSIDPRFSSAYGLMANCHVHRLNRGWGSVDDARREGLKAAKLAARTGRDDPRALGWAANGIARFGGSLEEAVAHIERALALSPDSVHVRRMSGYTYFVAGNHERSIEHFKRAMQLDPMDPWAFHSCYGIALPYFFTGHYEDALAWVDKALVSRPNYASPLRLKIAASAMAGRPSGEIQAAIARLHTVEPELSITELMQRIAHFRQLDLDVYARALRLAGLPE
jgi:TolB-like protein/Tfp pilus assembly protein PilF